MKTAARIAGGDRLIAKFKAHPQLIHRTMESVLKQEARALCVEYGSATAPFGFQEAPAEKFRGRVEGDVRRVFASRTSPSAVYQMMKVHAPQLAPAYWHAYKSKKTRSMAAIVRKANLPEGLSPAAHKAARTGKKGRVAGLEAPVSLANEAQLRTYVRKQRQLVGFAKAGWYAAAKGLGGRVRRNLVLESGKRKTEEIFPAYVRALARKFPDAGGARITSRGSKVNVEIFTRVRHSREALSDAAYFSATQRAETQLANALAQSLRALNEKKFGSRIAS